MRLPVTLVSVLAAPLMASAVSAQQPSLDPRQITGEWHGTARIPVDNGLPVNLSLRVTHEAGAWKAFLTLPESRQLDLELPSRYSDSASVVYADGRLRLEYTPDIGFAFLQNLGLPRESERIILDVSLRGQSLRGRLQITGAAGDVELHRDPPPKAYREEAIAFASTADALRLHGALIRPLSGERHPAAVFITGSDPDTRYQWLLEAAALARRGVASLLYDKRGVGESTGASHDLASWDDLAGDVEGAVEYLRTRSDVVDTAAIGLIGQSQGTWMISKVASRNPHVAFVVNISGGAMSAAEQETYRTGAMMRRAGYPEQEIERAVSFQRQKFDVARTGFGWEALDSVMQQLRRDSVSWFPGFGTGAAARSLAILRLYGVLQFNYDPRRDLAKIRVPMLLIMGSEDVVFPPDTVAARVRSVLHAHPDLTVRILPGIGHGMGRRQASRGQPFRWVASEDFVELLSSWVADRTPRRPN